MSDASPVTPTPDDIRRPARVGMALFAVYVALYGGFMGLNVFRPQWMAATAGGVNIAILYGFGLIAAAMALALMYAKLCGRGDRGDRGEQGDRGGKE